MKALLSMLLLLGMAFSGTGASSPALGIGIMYLTASDEIDDPIHDLSDDPEWTEPLVQGVAIRTQWGRIEPTEGNFYWDYLDQAFALATTYNKKISLLVTAGVPTPSWVYTAGAYELSVTTDDGVKSMPLPWDSVFQTKWGNVIEALATRYGDHAQLVYVVTGGTGRKAESFFVTTEADQATMDAKAVVDGFADGLEAWEVGAKWVIGKYATEFPKGMPIILDMGSPYPTNDGEDTLADVTSWGSTQYPGRFAVKSDGLGADYDLTSLGATEVQRLSPTCKVGYQMTLPQKGKLDSATKKQKLDVALNVGTSLGAHFIEVYAADFKFDLYPLQEPAIKDASARMIAPTALANISTRLLVGTGDNVLIGGFIVDGMASKKVIVRAIGPSLPLSGSLTDPQLELRDSSGELIASNDNWRDAPNKQEIIESALQPANNFESAILSSLPPGLYTAIVAGTNVTTGVALVEAYDLDRTVDSTLANISTRGLVQTIDDVMIGGFIALGADSRTVLVRAIGPSLPVGGKLDDPTLELHDADGLLLSSNDNWRSGQEAEIIATNIAPANDLESAILMTLPPAAYTAIVRSANGTTGVALVEIYALQ